MAAYRRLAITYCPRARFLRGWLLRPQMPLPVAPEIHARLARVLLLARPWKQRERVFSWPRTSRGQTLIRQRGRPSLRGHRKTALPEVAPVAASAQAPVDKVKIR